MGDLLRLAAGMQRVLQAAVVVLTALVVADAQQPVEEAWEEDHMATSASGRKSYKGHALVRFVVETEEDKAALELAVEHHGLDVMAETPGKHSVVRVPPSVQLTQLPLRHDVISHDIEPLLLLEANGGEGFHQKYHDATEIATFATNLQQQYPQWVEVEELGKSIQGHPITAVHIKAQEAAQAPIVFVQAGQHAREWIGPAASWLPLRRWPTRLPNTRASRATS